MHYVFTVTCWEEAYCVTSVSQPNFTTRWWQVERSEGHCWTKARGARWSSTALHCVTPEVKRKDRFGLHMSLTEIFFALDTKTCSFSSRKQDLLWAELQHYSSDCNTNLRAISSLTSREKQAISGLAGAVSSFQLSPQCSMYKLSHPILVERIHTFSLKVNNYISLLM